MATNDIPIDERPETSAIPETGSRIIRSILERENLSFVANAAKTLAVAIPAAGLTLLEHAKRTDVLGPTTIFFESKSDVQPVAPPQKPRKLRDFAIKSAIGIGAVVVGVIVLSPFMFGFVAYKGYDCARKIIRRFRRSKTPTVDRKEQTF